MTKFTRKMECISKQKKRNDAEESTQEYHLCPVSSRQMLMDCDYLLAFLLVLFYFIFFLLKSEPYFAEEIDN